MNFNFFASLFIKKTKKSELILPDSILIKNFKELCKKNNYSFYENITIYHHSQNIFIPLLIFSPDKGIYIFEYKQWSYNDLTNYTLEKSSNTTRSKDTLSYERINKFIKTKFNEILHNDAIDTFNFLITENLSLDDYKHLDDAKQKLLPFDKVIFNNSTEEEIISKMTKVDKLNLNEYSSDFILANLFTQYLVLDNPQNLFLASQEQINILHNHTQLEIIYGHANSGKTTTLLLKALLLKLENTSCEITIIEPTTLSCDKFKAKLLDTIEYAIVDVDITSIKVLTPNEFKATKKISHYVLCDDANLLDDDFIEYLYAKSSKINLSLVNPKGQHTEVFKLTHNFNDAKINVEFIHANPIASAMQTIDKYAKEYEENSILCISSSENKIKLYEDLKFFINDKVIMLDSSKKIIDQEEASIILSDYDNINAHKSDIILLLDIDIIDEDRLAYAINLSRKKVYFIYEDECQKIINLKKIFAL